MMVQSKDIVGSVDLMQVFCPSLVASWFTVHDPDANKRRNRRLPPVVLFFGILMYATLGLKNLAHAFSDALALFNPHLPPEALSKGSLAPAHKRLPLAVLQSALVHARKHPQIRSNTPILSRFEVRCIDGTTFSVSDSDENDARFGRPKASRGKTGYPRLRSMLVMDAATHVFVDETHDSYYVGEATLCDRLLERHCVPNVLLEADRNFYSYQRACNILTWHGNFLIRIKDWVKTPVIRELEDGSYVTVLLWPKVARRKKWREALFAELRGLSTAQLLQMARLQHVDLQTNQSRPPESLLLRVIEYDVMGVDETPQHTKLLCSVMQAEELSAKQAAEGYHLRWSEEVGIRELKWLRDNFRIPHLPGKSPDSVEQELAALLLVHTVLRIQMQTAAKAHNQDPRRLSLSGAKAVLLRYLPAMARAKPQELPKWLESLLGELARHQNSAPKSRVCPRTVKVKMSGFQTKSRCGMPPSVIVKRNLVISLPSANSG